MMDSAIRWLWLVVGAWHQVKRIFLGSLGLPGNLPRVKSKASVAAEALQDS